jgi:glycosyltransferase involved in cell wall biosynthesis
MIYIITINFNDAINLKRTIDSVRKYKIEYQRFIIIDGGSTDDSLKIIQSNLDVIDNYLSEPDCGIYDAMNKVSFFDLQDSDFLIWINAGDELIDWKNVIDCNFLIKYDAAFFSVIAKTKPEQSGKIRIPNIHIPYDEKNFFPKSQYYHQGFLIRYGFFKKVLYDTTIGIQAENLLMSKAIIDGNYFCSPEPLSIYYLGGISNTNYKAVNKSYFKVAKALEFNITKLYFYKRIFILKLFILRMLPTLIIEKLKDKLYD